MVKINYRIVEDFDVLKKIDKESFDLDYDCISGFFRFVAGEQHYGDFYHENPLQKGEVGMDLLDLWLELLLDAMAELSDKNYIAFLVPDTAYIWLEFKKQGERISISSYTDKNVCDGWSATFRTEPINGITSKFNNAYQTEFTQLATAIINVVKQFISELGKINVELLKVRMTERLLQKLSTVKTQQRKPYAGCRHIRNTNTRTTANSSIHKYTSTSPSL